MLLTENLSPHRRCENIRHFQPPCHWNHANAVALLHALKQSKCSAAIRLAPKEASHGHGCVNDHGRWYAAVVHCACRISHQP